MNFQKFKKKKKTKKKKLVKSSSTDFSPSPFQSLQIPPFTALFSQSSLRTLSQHLLSPLIIFPAINQCLPVSNSSVKIADIEKVS